MSPAPRPSWHVDLKWVFGLLLTVILFLNLLLAGAVLVTAERPAVDAMTMATALLFSQKGLDDETELVPLKKVARANPEGVTKPIPFLAITISNKDILTLPARELRLTFFRNAAESVYRSGPEGLAALAQTPEIRKSIIDGGSAFRFISADSHQGLLHIFWPFLLASALFCIPLLWFSRGFGKFASLGVVTLIAALPTYLLLSFLLMASTSQPAPPVPTEKSGTAMATYIAAYVLPGLLPVVRRPFEIATVVGAALVFISMFGKIGVGFVQKMRRKREL